jgi:tetratricopeptide (TPR) repeat protein
MSSKSAILASALLGVAAAVFAAGGGGDDGATSGAAWSSSRNEDPTLKAAWAWMAAGDWAGAQLLLKVALAVAPDNADLHNLYAYSIRKGARPDMDLVFKHYGEALRIDPKHRGAHEYMGEAYLMVDNPAKAREHLAALDRLCFFGCEEYTDLKKALAAYDAKPRQ